MAGKKRQRRRSATQPVAPPPRWSGWQSPWLVAVVAMAPYILWLAIYLPRSHGGLDFLFIDPAFLQHNPPHSAIQIDPSYLASVQGRGGYDGEFYYYIATDPQNARYDTDGPAYRYTRILYPMLARVLAAGQASAIPYTMVLINLLAIGGGTLALALWLKRRKRSPWFALIFGLYPGLFVSLSLDLTEPMAYALVALAIYLLDVGGRRRLLWAGLTFALATLTREISAIFPAVYTVAILLAADFSAPMARAHHGKLASRGPLWRGIVAPAGPLQDLFAALAGLFWNVLLHSRSYTFPGLIRGEPVAGLAQRRDLGYRLAGHDSSGDGCLGVEAAHVVGGGRGIDRQHPGLRGGSNCQFV